MVITCPTCDKHYYVLKTDLSQARPVKCSACGSVWVAEPAKASDLPVLDLQTDKGPSDYGALFQAKKQRLAAKKKRSFSLPLVFWLCLGSVALTLSNPHIQGQIRKMVKRWTQGPPNIKPPALESQEKLEATASKEKADAPHPHVTNLKFTPGKAKGRFVLTGTLHNKHNAPTPVDHLELHFLKKDDKGAFAVQHVRLKSLKTFLAAKKTLDFSYTLQNLPGDICAVSVFANKANKNH